jgi:hypothetical protein
MFLVKWRDFDESEVSWELLEEIEHAALTGEGFRQYTGQLLKVITRLIKVVATLREAGMQKDVLHRGVVNINIEHTKKLQFLRKKNKKLKEDLAKATKRLGECLQRMEKEQPQKES